MARPKKTDTPEDMEMCLNCTQGECTNCLSPKNKSFYNYSENMKSAGRSGEVPKKEDPKNITPGYYKRDGVECYSVVKLMTKNLKGSIAFSMGNVIKYLWRFTDKNGLEDLKKARTYMDKMIKEYEGGAE